MLDPIAYPTLIYLSKRGGGLAALRRFGYIYIYPPPRFARRREWVILPTCPVSLPLPLCLCLSVPKPLPLPKPKPMPSSSGVWFRGSDNPRVGMAGAWRAPPKNFQNQSKIVSFLNPFSNAFLDRFLVHFASQLASQNPLKCVKNRCQDAFHLGLHFWIDFWLIFAPNLDPLNPIWH